MKNSLGVLKEIVAETSWSLWGYLVGFNLLVIISGTDHGWVVLFILLVLDLVAIMEPYTKKHQQNAPKILSDEKLQTRKFKRLS